MEIVTKCKLWNQAFFGHRTCEYTNAHAGKVKY